MIEDLLKEVQSNCEHLLTFDQLEHVRIAMAHYAQYALMDTAVANEATSICLAYCEADHDQE